MVPSQLIRFLCSSWFSGTCKEKIKEAVYLLSSSSTPFRAHACPAWPDSNRYPAATACPSVGATGLQPHPLSHLLLVPVLPLLHANRGQQWEQRHRQRVPVCGSQHVSLHAKGPAAFPFGPHPAGVVQPRRQEGEPRGHLPD